MSELKATPGPWEVAGRYGPDGWRVGARGYDIATALYLGGTDPAHANARLIAAAPELYDGCNALLGLIQLIRGRPDLPSDLQLAIRDDNHRIAEAQAAVAKARGETA